MKTIIRSTRALFIGALFLIGSVATAQLPSISKSFAVAAYPGKDPQKLWMHVEKYTSEKKISVQLVGPDNRVLFTENLPRQASTYRQKFDMENLADGAYTLRITDGSETVEKSFQLTTPGIQERLPKRLLTVVSTDESTGRL